MNIQQIVTYPAAVLRKKTRPIKRFDDHLARLVDEMFDVMSEGNGIGLAAPQIGKSKKVVVVDTMEPGGRYALVNPRVVWTSKDTEPFKEGCLSLPGVEGYVIRPLEVRVRAQRWKDGEELTIHADGMLARVLQHEIDHLNGVLFVDYLNDQQRIAVEPLLREMEAA